MQNKLWWIIPTIFTIFSFTIAWIKADRPSDIDSFVCGFFTQYIATMISNIAMYITAFVASLLCWLVYFIIF